MDKSENTNIILNTNGQSVLSVRQLAVDRILDCESGSNPGSTTT